MTDAMEKFFPESDFPKSDEAGDDTIPSHPDDYPLQRTDTGITSIVGSNNGDRPGGFVLVIEGTALGHVSRFMLQRSDQGLTLLSIFRH